MSSKKDWKKLKVTFLIIDIVLLVLVVAIGAFCGYRLYGISQLKNNGYTDSMAKLDQEEQRIRDDMLKRQPEVAAAVAEAEAALAQAELDLAGSQDALKVVTDQRDAVNGDIQEVQAKIDSIGSMEHQIADLRTEYGQACRQLEDMILAGESKYRICYLTFDDGPSYMTENFLKELDRLDVYATFFTIGVGVQPNSYGLRDKMLKEEAKGGHTIANHTYTHAFNSGDASAEAMGHVRTTLDNAGVIWQIATLGKVDQGGGGTVAADMANRNIVTVDAGVPVLNMHAPLELVSKLDCYMTMLGCKAIYLA